MPKNPYQRRRTLREPTSPTNYQNEPIQGAIQTPTNQSSELGREDARQLRENKNPNTRFVDKPSATNKKNALRSAAARQEAVMRNAQRQVFGEQVVPHVKPQGKFSAPRVPQMEMKLVAQGGGIRLKAVPKASIASGVVGAVVESIPQMIPEQTQAVGDWIWDNTLGWVLNETFGTNTKIADARRNVELSEQYEQQLAEQDAENQRIYQQRLEDAAMPIREGEAPDTPILPPSPSQTLVDASQQLPRHIPKAYSQSSSEDSRNREYKIRRDALGDNPTKEEMDAVRDYGLEQHRKYFPKVNY